MLELLKPFVFKGLPDVLLFADTFYAGCPCPKHFMLKRDVSFISNLLLKFSMMNVIAKIVFLVEMRWGLMLLLLHARTVSGSVMIMFGPLTLLML